MFQRGEHRHRVVIGKDTRLSGYMIENALVGRLHLGRHGRAAARPDADAGGRHADALDARRSRRDDLGLAQSLSRTTASSCSGRTATSSPTRSRREIEALIDADLAQALAKSRRSRPRQAHRRACTPATSNSPSAPCRAASLDGLRIVVDCANGAAYKVAPEALWELGAEVIADRRRAGRLQHQPRRRLDRAGGAGRARCARCAPTSASRSTATPTAC